MNTRISTFARGMTMPFLVSGAMIFGAVSAHAAVIISEVDPSGSASGTYNADWFELTNTGSSAVDITGWKMDDNSDSFASAVGLRGVTSIAAGQSVVFVEGNTSGSNDATLDASFVSAWFGASPPAGFTIGNYGGSGVSLSQTTDEVNIFDSVGNPITGVRFDASATGVTFDNAAGIGGTGNPRPTISQVSVVGVNGAFLSPTGETGSPGTIGAAVPEPSSITLLTLAAAALLIARRRA